MKKNYSIWQVTNKIIFQKLALFEGILQDIKYKQYKRLITFKYLFYVFNYFNVYHWSNVRTDDNI